MKLFRWQSVARDPDPNVRFELLRDGQYSTSQWNSRGFGEQGERAD
jgi:hypothetical protein